jgi:ABC-type bacteriocin/lantibiotic exporter with double-glycine peptidase domain
VRLQSGQNSCGPAAVANALRALGKTNITEEKVAARLKNIASTGDPAIQTGTIEEQIVRALKSFKVPATQIQVYHPGVAVMALRGFLSMGFPVLLAVANDEHWVCATGWRGRYIDLVDSAAEELVVPYKDVDLAGHWACVGEVHRFYGIAVGVGVR